MSDPAPSAEAPSLASRLGQSRVGLTRDLEVSRHVFRSEPAYVIRNPLTLQCHLFSAEDYGILVRIRSESSLAEIFDQLVADEILDRDREESFYHFVFGLHRLGFLQLPIPDDKILYGRYRSILRAKRWQRATSLFFLQVPLFNPDAFLERTIGIGRVLFSRAFFFVWSAHVTTRTVSLGT